MERLRVRLFPALHAVLLGGSLLLHGAAQVAVAAQDDPVRTYAEVEATAQAVLAAYEDPQLASYGILDVTLAPYNVDPTGQTDSTAALQQAMKDARDTRLVTYLPPGRYLVSDTLECVQGHITDGGQWRNDEFPCVLRGAGADGRARIVLAPNAPGFGDPDVPKPLIYIWSRKWSAEDPSLQPNISFNQMILSLDVEIGAGNPGAMAIDLQCAQGCAIDDVTIDAGDALAGLRGLPGSGGGTNFLTVRGGDYGVLAVGFGAYAGMRGSQPSALLNRVTLLDQRLAAIRYEGRGPLTVVGGRIRGAGLECNGANKPYNGACSLVDTSIEVTTGTPAVSSNRGIYLQNTFITGTADLVQLDGATVLSGSPTEWAHVQQFAAGPSATYPVWVDGVKLSSPLQQVVPSAGPPPANLQAPHGWQEPFVSWEAHDAVNVREAPYLAVGDGVADDTAALQNAIDENTTVFIPKGQYLLSQPLTLHANTRLVGIGNMYSVLLPDPTAPAYCCDELHPSPLVVTDDDPAATTVLADLHFRLMYPGAYALDWRAGRNSLVRHVRFRRWPWFSEIEPEHPQVLVRGSGGGRWFHIHSQARTPQGPGYRHFAIHGTREPLAFYVLNPEHAAGDVQAEFLDVRNVSVFASKAEMADGSQKPPLLHVADSQQFQLIGFGGIANVYFEVEEVFHIESSTNFLLANFAPQTPNGVDPGLLGPLLREIPLTGPAVITYPAEDFAMYQRGAPAVPLPPAIEYPPPGPEEFVPRASTAPIIDGIREAAWDGAPLRPLGVLVQGTPGGPWDLDGWVRAMWDDTALYLLVFVFDDVAGTDSGEAWWNDDGIEAFIDVAHDRSEVYGPGDFHFVMGRGSGAVRELKHGNAAGVSHGWSELAGGYQLEVAFPWATLGRSPVQGDAVGIDVQVRDDDDGGGWDARRAWFDATDRAWRAPEALGTGRLAGIGLVEYAWSFQGTAQGGSVDFWLGPVQLSVPTSAGQAAAEVALAVTDAIKFQESLNLLGVLARTEAATVWTNAEILTFTINDPGLLGPSIPAVSEWGVIMLAIGILVAGTVVWSRKMNSPRACDGHRLVGAILRQQHRPHP